MASKKETLFRDLNEEQLKSRLLELQKEYQQARFNKVSGDDTQAHKIKKARKDIARIKTFLTQHKLGIKK